MTFFLKKNYGFTARKLAPVPFFVRTLAGILDYQRREDPAAGWRDLLGGGEVSQLTCNKSSNSWDVIEKIENETL